MLFFIARRLLMLIPVIIGLTVIMFAIARLLPGDPVGLAARGPRVEVRGAQGDATASDGQGL